MTQTSHDHGLFSRTRNRTRLRDLSGIAVGVVPLVAIYLVGRLPFPTDWSGWGMFLLEAWLLGFGILFVIRSMRRPADEHGDS